MSRSSRRKKHIAKPKKLTEQERKARAVKALIAAITVVVLIVAAVLVFYFMDQSKNRERLEDFEARAESLHAELISDARQDEMGSFNADGAPEDVVFLSICDKTQRATVFTGTGNNREAAWSDAYEQAHQAVTDGYDPVWIKADLMSQTQKYSANEFSELLSGFRHEFFRYGIAFDGAFSTALLEAELNGAKILDYDNECIDKSYLNTYLEKAGRSTLPSLPDEYIVFKCIGWMCDEDGKVLELISDTDDYGRRAVDTVDKQYAAELITNASGFLIDQVQDDGKFIYGYYPRFGNEIDNYNIVRHASTLWSLVCQYRMTENDELVPVIERAIDYMIENAVIYRHDDTAYLYEEKSDEIKLGGCGVAIVALTEYMDAFGSDKYADVAKALGNGILTMFRQDTGEYYHVLDGDFIKKEQFRTVYYDGEATFALCRLHSLTGDEKWLDAAKAAVEHFIKADYVQYKDHWVAYSLNEITKYVDDERYYTFALRNAQENLDRIYYRDTTYHTYFELLMSTFEVYERIIERGIELEYLDNSFDLEYFLKTIYKRADHMLSGYFYPEYAMYMASPETILDTFMVRHDGYRVRIDDVQHNVGGYYLYYLHYDRLVELGMLDYRD